MKTSSRIAGALVCSAVLLGLSNNQLQAQSGNKSTASVGSGMKSTAPAGSEMKSMQGSDTHMAMQDELGLEGYCPVCVVMGKGWVKGDSTFQSSYDGKVYYFPSADVKQMFDQDPAKYLPALGGDCTVCLKAMGKRVPGSVQFSALHNDRLFLFPDEGAKQKFEQDPDSFADVDLASEGNCTVCSVEMQKQVAGKPEITVMHEGMRYQFPSEEQKTMFIANPEKYKVDTVMIK